jgi:hypothetical protein
MARLRLLAVAGAALIMMLTGPAEAVAGDRHAEYYYPSPVTQETYSSRAATLDTASRELRLGFVTALTERDLGRSYPPRHAIFAKGEDAEKLIIVSMTAEGFHTLYQARGLLAQLTAEARGTQLFRELAVDNIFTYFDLLKMLGFVQLTISDGETFSHQVIIE